MKRYNKKRHTNRVHNTERLIARKIRQEQDGGFKCSHCKTWTVINQYMGTANRNHCNVCLWSRHVDTKKGDRRATCQAGMRPIGLTFKHEGQNRQGEIMLIHVCAGCPKISINRIAADDADDQILAIFEASLSMLPEDRSRLQQANILLAGEQDRQSILNQLFGF